MPGTNRVHQRRARKSGAAKIGLALALVGVLVVGAVVAGVIVFRPELVGRARPAIDASGTGGADAAEATAPGDVPADIPAGSPPQAGWPLEVTTPDGYRYSMAAVTAGTRDRPSAGGTPSPSGAVYAYADYVLSNTQNRPVLLDFPIDLFIDRAIVPESERSRCMPQPGVPGDMCTLPNQSQIALRLRNSEAPIVRGADTFIPPGASYLVRVVTDLPVKKAAGQADMRLYVWNVRFTTDRKAIEVAFP
jgi:hypothetical protein